MDDKIISESELEEWLTQYGKEFDRCTCGSDNIWMAPGFVYNAKLDKGGKVISVSKIDMSCYSMFSDTPYCPDCGEEVG